MTAPVADTGSAIIPTLRYRDAPAAIDWLCRVFGFQRHVVYDDGAGGIAHAQLTYSNGMIMLGSLRDDAWGARTAMPDEICGRHTQAC